MVNGVKYVDLYDSGSNFTTITPRVTQRLGIPVKAERLKIRSFGSERESSLMTLNIALNSITSTISDEYLGEKSTENRVVVKDFPGLPFDVLLGREVAEKLGIRPTGIPFSFPSVHLKDPVPIDETLPDEKKLENEDPELLAFRNQLMNTLKPLLDKTTLFLMPISVLILTV
jgi:hypothetical protein